MTVCAVLGTCNLYKYFSEWKLSKEKMVGILHFLENYITSISTNYYAVAYVHVQVWALTLCLADVALGDFIS